MKTLLLIVSLLFLQTAAFAYGPVSAQTLQKINELFLENGELSLSKVNAYKENLQNLRDEVKSNIQNIRNNNHTQITRNIDLKKPAKNKFIRHINFLRDELLSQSFVPMSKVELIEHLSNIIDFENALRIQIIPGDLSHKLDKIKILAKRYYLEKEQYSLNPHATNLINPATNTYFTQSELSSLIASGVDISRFDPPKNNGTIELLDDISKSNIIDRYRNGNNPMHEGLNVGFPKTNIGYLKEIRKTQSRMKLIFETRDSLGNRTGEYKLKMGLEVHSETTSASLAVALGMYQDLSKHVRNIKIYTGDMNYNDFVKDFTSYFTYEELQRVVVENGFDNQKNQYYIIFNEGVLEHRFKSGKLQRIGPMYPGLRRGRREARALIAFNLWIGNGDQKPGENNKLLRRMDKDQLYYSQHDLGFGYGYFERERPTDFRWDIVLKNDAHGVLFDFRNIIPSPYLNIMNFSDGKWMIRKIAQLSREQITEAVKLGKWPNKAPYNYEQLIIEKLINRRNQLVEVFGLLGEQLPNGGQIELMAVNRGIDSEAIPTSTFLPGYTSDFRPALKYKVIYPALESAKNLFINRASNLVADIGRADVPHSWIGIDDGGAIAQVLFGSGKKIIKNPDPQNINERYLVREHFKIGSRLGYGEIFSADGAVVKEYSIIYPVEDKSHVDLRGKWFIDFSVPYSILKNFLPPKHILISETYLEGRGRLRVEFPSVGPGAQATLSRIHISKQVMLTQKGKTETLFSDQTNFNKAAQALFIKLGIVRSSHFVSDQSSGKFQRYIYNLEQSETRSIDNAVMNGVDQNREESNFVLESVVKSQFFEYSSRWGFFSFFSRQKKYSSDDILVFEPNGLGGLNQVSHQIEGRYIKKKKWRRVFVGEEKIADVSMSSLIAEGEKIIKPEIILDFLHQDTHTTAFEIDQGYIPFFNGVARDKKFIQYSAAKHAIDHYYGILDIGLKQVIHEEGVKKLLTLTSDTYFSQMSSLLKLDNIRTNRQKYVFYQGRSYKRTKLIKKSYKVLNWIMQAQRNTNYKNQVHDLVRAISSAIPSKGQSQNPLLLATLNLFLGQENFYLEAFIAPPSNIENKFPGDIIPFNSQGENGLNENRKLTKLRAYEAIDLWNQFK